MTAITEKEIELKIEQVQASFNNISSKLRELEATDMNLQRKKSEMNVELFRLQGEKRVLRITSYNVCYTKLLRVPNKRLPNMGMLPKDIHIGQMIGMFESKQDLYLLIAWLSNRVSDLEEVVESLTSKDNL